MPKPIAAFKGFKWRGWMGIFILVPAGVVGLLGRPLVQQGTGWELLLHFLAWCAFVASATMRFWSTLYLGGRKSKVAVSEGPYSLVRHPLYWGSFLMGLSASLFLQSAVMTAAVVVAAAMYAALTIPTEERYLSEALGDSYVQYLQATPRFIPRRGTFRTADPIQVDVGALRNEARRALGWIWLPFLALVLEYVRAQSWWPVIFPLS